MRPGLAPDAKDEEAIVRFDRSSTGTHRFNETNMEIKSIDTTADYRAALVEIERLMSACAGSPEGARLHGLVTLVEMYEGKHFPVPDGSQRC